MNATGRVWAQPLVVVRDVEASSAFYCSVLGLASAHGGPEYGQLVRDDGEMVLQLHDAEVDHHHDALANLDQPVGNGVILWFEVADIDTVAAAVAAGDAEIVRPLETNPNAQQREIWFRDLDGYTVVAAGPSEYRPR